LMNPGAFELELWVTTELNSFNLYSPPPVQYVVLRAPPHTAGVHALCALTLGTATRHASRIIARRCVSPAVVVVAVAPDCLPIPGAEDEEEGAVVVASF
jgi:hypothetical protein